MTGAGKLRLVDVFYAPTPEGAYLLTPRGPHRLTGASICQWLDRLRPMLDGSHTTAELLAGVSEQRRPALEQLLSLLVDRGIAQVETPPGPRGPLAVLGDGGLLPATVRAATLAVADPVRAVVLGGTTVDAGEDGQVTWAACAVADLDSIVDGCAAVVHVQSAPRAGEARAVMELCQQLDLPLTQAVLLGNEIWISPPGSRGWTIALSRLRRPLMTEPVRDHPAGLALAAATLARSAAGTRRTAAALTVLDLETLHSSDPAIRPHPFDLPASAEPREVFRARTDRLADAEPIGVDDFARQVMSLVDDEFGVLGEWSEVDFVQLPVHVTSTKIADPTGLPGESPIIGTGPDLDSARHRTAMRALAVYCSRVLDPRRLLTAAGAALGHGDPAEMVTALCREQVPSAWMWGRDLLDGAPRLVEVERVFPWLRGDSGIPRGIAASYSWSRAVCDALLDLCSEIVAAVAESGLVRPRPVALPGGPSDQTTARYIRILDSIGEPVSVYDLSSALDVPAFAFRLGGATVAYRCGLSSAEALREGLEQVLVSYQARRHDQPAYAPPPVRSLPPADGPVSAWPGDDGDLSGLADLTARIANHGHRPVAVPLDHDPEVHDVMPFAVAVVMPR